MRSFAQRIIHFTTYGAGRFFLLLALAACVASISAHAQDSTWKVDGEHSIARLSLGSEAKSAEIGVARISGNVVFDSNDPADPVVNLKIAPDKSLGASSSEISFKSKRSEINGDGKLAVIGDLSVTRVERSVTMNPSEGYYGAEYGEPVVQTDTQEVTLVFPSASLAVAHSGTMELSASTNISRERFPQLLAALAPGNWPSMVVEDENCAMPSTVGEDYSGGMCTGSPIETATNSVAPASVGGGDGYYGFEPAVVPDGSQATIALSLKLTRIATTASAVSRTAETAGN